MKASVAETNRPGAWGPRQPEVLETESGAGSSRYSFALLAAHCPFQCVAITVIPQLLRSGGKTIVGVHCAMRMSLFRLSLFAGRLTDCCFTNVSAVDYSEYNLYLRLQSGR